MRSGSIERASSIDLMELAATTVPAAGQIGAVLVLATAPFDLDALRSTLSRRVTGVPRLRQRLRPVPLGCGRPIWIDDPSFDIAHHVNEERCLPPGDRSAVLAMAADLVARRLPPGRPLWSATLVTGLADDAVAVVLVFHHVMADGMAGLAVLAHLVDGGPTLNSGGFPRAAPSWPELLVDAMRARVRAATRLGDAVRRLRRDGPEHGTGWRPVPAPRCSLNRPTGPRRCLAVARTNLDAVRAAARQQEATVNDAALAAITGALGRHLRDQREDVDDLVVSIPVSGRRAAAATQLGNQVGVMAVLLPTGGTAEVRLRAIAAITRARKQAPHAASAAVLALVFRVLAATRTLRWCTDHQRMVTTFVTNLRGPANPVALLGATVTELIPVNSTSGNVRVAFGVFSYAGTLSVTLVADASLAGDLPTLVASLETEFDLLGATNELVTHDQSDLEHER